VALWQEAALMGLWGCRCSDRSVLGIGLFYELFSRLDVRDALSTRAHWTLAMAATLVLIVGVAAVMLRPA
jgi:hypothetical protein